MRKFIIILNIFCIAFLYPGINLDDYQGENPRKTLVDLCYFITTDNNGDIPDSTNAQQIVKDFINSEKLNGFKLHILSHGHLGYYSFTRQYIENDNLKKENIFNTQPRGVFLIDEEISARIYNVRNETVPEYKYICQFLNGNAGILSYDIIDPIVPQNKLSLQQFLDQKILLPVFMDGVIESVKCINIYYEFNIIVNSNSSHFQAIGISQDTGIPTNRVRFVCRKQGYKLVPLTLYPI